MKYNANQNTRIQDKNSSVTNVLFDKVDKRVKIAY